MLLYKTQPKDTTTSNIINKATKDSLMESLSLISSFNNKRVEYNDFVTLVTDASLLDGLLTSTGYQNILVVTSFEDSKYDRLRDRNYRAVKSAGDHLLPFVHKINESDGNMVVTMPVGADNYMRPLIDEMGIDTIDIDSYWRIDQDFKIKTDVKFDAVVLLGCEASISGKYKANDIKAKFAKYCTGNFDLIDVNRNTQRALTGGTFTGIEEHIKRMIDCVNTPNKLYYHRSRIDPTAPYMKNLRQMLMYYRLGINIETVNEWYKVY